MAVLSEDEIHNKLQNLIGWYLADNKIHGEFQFKDFKSAVSFVNIVADTAELLNHHPDVYLHDWNQVKISISTHSEDGITEKDFILAEKIEALR